MHALTFLLNAECLWPKPGALLLLSTECPQPGFAVQGCKPFSWVPEVTICFLRASLQITFWQASIK